jgi:phage terminase large subunit
MTFLDIATPRAFAPLLSPCRYKGSWGGRGSGKSHFFAEMLVERALLQPGFRGVGIREVQKSIKLSVKQLIEDKIQSLGVSRKFQPLRDEIRTPGGGLIIFQGMQDHTADSIKSLEGFDVAWVEEAQNLSGRSMQLLRPTIRKPGSELWFSWNPESPDDPVDQLLRGEKRLANTIVVQANWRDNPWFPEVLEEERLSDLERSPDDYDHVWEGGYVTISEAVIFKNRVSVELFDTPSDARFFHGVDWGFSQDPTVLIRAFVKDEALYVDKEAFGYGLELDELPALFDTIPTARKWPVKADCSQPAMISHTANRGFDQISGAQKWSGSVEDGIACLKAFKRIVVHPSCHNIAKEFRLYSFKTDKRQVDSNGRPTILPIIVDKWNHGIDALRYALDGYIKMSKGQGLFELARQQARDMKPPAPEPPKPTPAVGSLEFMKALQD